MGLKADLDAAVEKTFRAVWTTRDGQDVPSDTNISLGNDGVRLEPAVLYADLADSSGLVKAYSAEFAAEIYKVYLHCAGRIIGDQGGTITAYDGDRIMAVFLGSSKNTSAVKAALKINYAVHNIIRPAQLKQYPNVTYKIQSKVGVDTSKVLVAKTGVRGANDLVWVGSAANTAAKLAALPTSYQTYISSTVYNLIADEAKYSNGANMWAAVSALGGTVYGSTYHWSIS